jgi:hypothetical protein
MKILHTLRYAITYGRYAQRCFPKFLAKGSAQRAANRHARFVAQSEWRLAPSATSRLSIRCWTRSRSSTASESISSLRRRRQINRVDVPLAVSFARSGAARFILGAIFHSRRVRPTKAAGPTSRTPCRPCAKRSWRTTPERRAQKQLLRHGLMPTARARARRRMHYLQ